jgi:hypothetical protein
MSSRDMLDPLRCHLMPDSPGCSEQAHAHALRQVRMTGRPVSVGGQQDQPSGGHRGLPADGHILTLRYRPGEATARERRGHVPARGVTTTTTSTSIGLFS